MISFGHKFWRSIVIIDCQNLWRGGRVVEGAALEMLCTRKGTEGSNPSLSASMRNLFIYNKLRMDIFALCRILCKYSLVPVRAKNMVPNEYAFE